MQLVLAFLLSLLRYLSVVSALAFLSLLRCIVVYSCSYSSFTMFGYIVVFLLPLFRSCSVYTDFLAIIVEVSVVFVLALCH